MIPFDTASNFLHKRTDLLDTSVSDAELFYGDSDAALPCNMYASVCGFICSAQISYIHSTCCILTHTNMHTMDAASQSLVII